MALSIAYNAHHPFKTHKTISNINNFTNKIGTLYLQICEFEMKKNNTVSRHTAQCVCMCFYIYKCELNKTLAVFELYNEYLKFYPRRICIPDLISKTSNSLALFLKKKIDTLKIQ